MFNIAIYLEKFRNLSTKDEKIKEEIYRAVKTVCGFEIDLKKISFKKGIIQLNLSPIERNEIFMKKSRLLAELKSRLQINILDLR